MPYNFEEKSPFLRNTSYFLRISNVFSFKTRFLFFLLRGNKKCVPPLFSLVVFWREECILRVKWLFWRKRKKSHEFKIVIFCFNKHIFFLRNPCERRILRHFYIRLCTQHCSHCLSTALLKVVCNINCTH